MENGLNWREASSDARSHEKIILSLASNASDGWMTTLIPFSSDQMIRNLSMKIGEVDSGSARLLSAASNLAGVTPSAST